MFCNGSKFGQYLAKLDGFVVAAAAAISHSSIADVAAGRSTAVVAAAGGVKSINPDKRCCMLLIQN